VFSVEENKSLKQLAIWYPFNIKGRMAFLQLKNELWFDKQTVMVQAATTLVSITFKVLLNYSKSPSH